MDFEVKRKFYLQSCETAIKEAVERFFQADSEVSRAAGYALTNGGKRVRGTLVLAVCDMLNGDAHAAGVFAAAIEMIHAFSLVHDDLPCMDDDEMRRGKPAAHVAFGEATALLAGDLLSLEAFDLIVHAVPDATMAAPACGLLARAAGAKGMIYGQELDLRYEKQPANAETLRLLHHNKTGALIRAACQLGVVAANRRPQKEGAVTQYAENVGLVFQIVDDILDVTADEAVLGKPVGSDVQQGKTTFVTMYGMESARGKIDELTGEAVRALRTQYACKADFLCSYAQALASRIM